MKPKSRSFRIWPLAMMVTLLLPAGYVGTASANGNVATRALHSDPLSLLAMRSAGSRGAGMLAQSKAAYDPSGMATEDFLGLSPEPDGPSGSEGSSLLPPPVSEPVSDTLPADDQASFVSLPGFDNAPDLGFFPGGFGGDDDDFIVGGDGFAPGGQGPLPGGQPPFVPPTAPSAVPEPGTWLMIVTGFLAVGSALRSRHRGEAASSADTIGPLPIGLE